MHPHRSDPGESFLLSLSLSRGRYLGFGIGSPPGFVTAFSRSRPPPSASLKPKAWTWTRRPYGSYSIFVSQFANPTSLWVSHWRETLVVCCDSFAPILRNPSAVPEPFCIEQRHVQLARHPKEEIPLNLASAQPLLLFFPLIQILGTITPQKGIYSHAKPTEFSGGWHRKGPKESTGRGGWE